MKLEEIHLDATTSSSLDWSDSRKEALRAIASGKKILWFLDLGLFQYLPKPLHNPAQFLTLRLALDHFRDTLWKEFRNFSIGAALYKGSADFACSLDADFSNWLKDRFASIHEVQKELKIAAETFEEAFSQSHTTPEGRLVLKLFARDVSADYLTQLALCLPDEIQAYVIFTSLPEDPLEKALLTNPERFGRIHLHHTADSFHWKTSEEHPCGICMPSLDMVKPSLLNPFRSLLPHEGKLIPEEQLTIAWDGLETLKYLPESLSKQGYRKVQGFIAAGGSVLLITDQSLKEVHQVDG